MKFLFCLQKYVFLLVKLDEHPVRIPLHKLIQESQEYFTLLEIYIYLKRLPQLTQFFLSKNAKHHLYTTPTLKRVIKALRSVAYCLPIAKTEDLFARHELFEEEDIFESFFDGRHNLDQYFGVDYLPLEIESEPILVLQVEDISADELSHLGLVGLSHLGHHELIDPH